MVTEVAEFSVRGGILDVYGFGMGIPARCEWWGNELVSLRGFDLTTQRSLEELSEITVLPVRAGGPMAVGPSVRQTLLELLPSDTLIVEESSGADFDEVARAWKEAEHHLEIARRIFEPLGRCLSLDERHMDAVTGLSASGPAYIYVVIESLAEGGVKVGLPRDVATVLAAQMVLGAASMVLQTGEHPAKLKDIVTTPAGCTIDGLLELEEGGLRVTLIKAVVRATRRAAELIHG